MTKIKTNKTANDIMWVEAWIKQAHPSLDFEISADKFGHKWKCEFDIPTVNKRVECISNTEVDAMLEGASLARKLIDEYLMIHPELKNIVDKYWSKDWLIEQDENGNFKKIFRDPNVRKNEGERFAQNISTVKRIIENALEKANEVFDYSGSFNIQVIDKKLFDSSLKLEEIERKVWDNYEKAYGTDMNATWQTMFVTDDCFIFIRYQTRIIDREEMN